MYTIIASGPGGTVSQSVTVTVTVIFPISLQITSPVDNATLSRPDVMVQGTITNSTGTETGVTVNGIVALVSGTQFIANHVPIAEGENSIRAVATDTAGNTKDTSITVTGETPTAYITITSDAEFGISPLETTLTIKGSFDVTATGGYLSYLGPGGLELLNSTVNTYSIRLSLPGLYTFFGEVEYQGTTYMDTVAILVLDEAVLDAMLQAKWNGMKEAMLAGDVQAAVQEFDPAQQPVFQEIFTIIQADMAQIAADMQPIELIYQKNDTVEYRIKRDIVFKGSPETVTSYIYFQRGMDGIWRIWDF